MAWRTRAYECHGARSDAGYDPTNNHGPEIPISAILAELNTRPHVPNKKEGKELRRLKAKQKH